MRTFNTSLTHRGIPAHCCSTTGICLNPVEPTPKVQHPDEISKFILLIRFKGTKKWEQPNCYSHRQTTKTTKYESKRIF